MVRYWRRTRDRGWQRRAAVNGVGAVATGLVTLVVIETKFTQGAWAVIVAIPLMVARFYGTQRHYRRVGRRLRAGVSAVAAAPPATNQVVLYVESVRRGAAGGALVRAPRSRATASARSPRRVARTDPGLRARFRELDEHASRPRGAAARATAASRR